MEDIIYILLALAALIFKVVEKKLNSSGKKVSEPRPERETAVDPQPETEFVEAVPAVVRREPEEPVVREMPMRQEAPVKPAASRLTMTPKKPKAPKTLKVKPAATSSVKPEKIDPKKLVIYSEIMKPKYNE